jgi:hypothetical protein
MSWRMRMMCLVTSWFALAQGCGGEQPRPGNTTATALIVESPAADDGELDVIVTLNHAPAITDLAFQPSKFVDACEKLTVTLTVEDPDGDNLVYDWSYQSPEGAEVTFDPSGSSLQFDSTKPGDHSVSVEVCDDLPAESRLCTSQTFPVHVMPGLDADQDGIPDLCKAQACIPVCGGRTCGLDPVCGASCGTCPPDTICIFLGFCAMVVPH